MYKIFVYFSLLLSVNTMNTSHGVKLEIKNQCSMLNIQSFYLNPSCFEMDNLAPIFRITTSTPEICQSQCCNFDEGACDMFYWRDRFYSCYLMDFSILNICTVLPGSPRSSYFSTSISLEVPQQFKKLLLHNGYREDIQSQLSCGENKFLCDDWSCRDEKCQCGGVEGCPDVVTENNGKCFGNNGQWYDPGESYLPHGDRDKCKICTCGNSSQPLYCVAPMCHHRSGDKCEDRPAHICCDCLHNLHPNETSPSNDYLNSSKRLIVSVIFVLMVIIVLLFFSKSARSPSSRSSEPRRGLRWLMVSSRPARRPSWQGRYSSQTDSFCFFDENGLPVEFFNRPPPPYSAIKPSPPPSRSPPSYRSSLNPEDETDPEQRFIPAPDEPAGLPR